MTVDEAASKAFQRLRNRQKCRKRRGDKVYRKAETLAHGIVRQSKARQHRTRWESCRESPQSFQEWAAYIARSFRYRQNNRSRTAVFRKADSLANSIRHRRHARNYSDRARSAGE